MPINPDSILDSIKKVLGIDYTDTTFDLDVTLFINSAFGSLQQMGVGPSSGFYISDNTTVWTDYVWRSDNLGMIKNYTQIWVKVAFDPPDSRFALPALQKMMEELAWRIVSTEETPLICNWWLLDNLTDFPTGASIGDFGFDSTTNNVYVNVAQSSPALWWDLTGLSDFPVDALVGDFGYSSSTGQVWRRTA